MATLLGITSKPTPGTEWFGLNSINQMAQALTLPAGGPWNIVTLGTWGGGYGENADWKLCLWSAGGTLLRSSSGGTVGTSITSIQQNITAYEVPGGTLVYVGFWRHPSHNFQVPMRSTTYEHLHDTTGSAPSSLSGFSAHSGQSLNSWLYYEASNALPTAPTQTAPATNIITTDATPVLDWTHNDPDGDAQSRRQVQVDESGGGYASPKWDTGDDATSSTSITYAGSALVRGTKYGWRVRTSDAEGYGPWSGTRYFTLNSLPTVTKTSPVTSGVAYIHNFGTDLTVWTLAGAHAKPRFTWTFADADGHTQSAYRVRVYSAASGGTELYDSGDVVSSSKTHDATWAGVNLTSYWWTVMVRDSLNEWSAESTRTGFYIRWSQAIYEYAVTGGASSSAWAFSAGGTVGGTAAYLYATATGAAGAGRSAWKTSIGSLIPAAYLNVLARLRNTTAGTVASIPSMTFTYLAASQQPDNWRFQTPATTDWRIDPEVRRFGSRSLRCTISTASGNRFGYPYEKFDSVSGLDIDVPVSPNTEYTASVYVNTGAVPVNADISLHIYGADDIITPLEGLYLDDSGSRTRDTWGLDSLGRPLHAEGWQRLWLRFRTQEQDRIRPMIHYGDADLGAATITIGDQFWIDAVQLEESAMPTPWRPGMVGQPVVLDVGGLIVDNSAGGLFRLRGGLGRTRDVVELGQRGLKFGGATGAEVYSAQPNRLRLGAGQMLENEWHGYVGWRSGSAAHGALAGWWRWGPLVALVSSNYYTLAGDGSAIVIPAVEQDCAYLLQVNARFLAPPYVASGRLGIGVSITASASAAVGDTPGIRYSHLIANSNPGANIYLNGSWIATASGGVDNYACVHLWQNAQANQTADNVTLCITRLGVRNYSDDE